MSKWHYIVQTVSDKPETVSSHLWYEDAIRFCSKNRDRELIVYAPICVQRDGETLQECRTADDHAPMLDYLLEQGGVRGLVTAIQSFLRTL